MKLYVMKRSKDALARDNMVFCEKHRDTMLAVNWIQVGTIDLAQCDRCEYSGCSVTNERAQDVTFKVRELAINFEDRRRKKGDHLCGGCDDCELIGEFIGELEKVLGWNLTLNEPLERSK